MQLPGPDWLKQRRGEAAERLATVELPSAEDEMWRYTPVGEIDLSRYHSTPAGSDVSCPASALAIGHVAALVQTINGRVVAVSVSDHAEEQGLEVGPATDAAGSEALLRDGPVDGAFDLVNQAYAADPIVVRVPDGCVIAGAVHVQNHVRGEATLSAPHLVVDIGIDAGATVVESHDGECDALVVARGDFIVADHARFRHTVVQQLGPSATYIARQRTVAGSQSTVSLAAIALGGGFARLRSDCRLDGRGASAVMLGASIAHGDQIVDFRTFQDHAAPDTTSELLHKNVLDDRARAITTGLIRVEPGARGTVAQQTNRTIKLSPDAWAESVPNLEIENDEVKCSHASSVGPIDEDQAFYLASRGVPPAIAERLIVTGFTDEVLGRLQDDELAAGLRSTISERLRGGR